MIACHKAMKADTDKIKPDPGMMQSCPTSLQFVLAYVAKMSRLFTNVLETLATFTLHHYFYEWHNTSDIKSIADNKDYLRQRIRNSAEGVN
jgi:hypothetical protein